jgi:2-keto-4-pentenoate hydratase/2-oxohepta-3-ene-1,7-dioic acid hydratase in catechol pathway
LRWADGELPHHAALTDQLFGFAELIKGVSSIITLEPGNASMAATPAGIALVRAPPSWL